MTSTHRRRRSGEESRERILDATEARLLQVGPDGIRLTELAAQLGLSHPAILHHFGSREGLVRAVLERAYDRLRADVVEALVTADLDDDATAWTEALITRARRVLGERGHARLFAWLVLGDRELPELLAGQPLVAVVDAVQAARAARGGAKLERDELSHVVHLVGLVLLGDALFGARLWSMQGARERGRTSFDHWLAERVAERLLPGPRR